LLIKPVELGYAVISATDIAAWTNFAGEVLGAMPAPGPVATLSIILRPADEKRRNA